MVWRVSAPHLHWRPEGALCAGDCLRPSDPQIAHLHGLNLSRAWAFVRLAEALPEGDDRAGAMLEAAERHALASLPVVTGSDYMVEHWLAAYAVLLLSPDT